MAASGFVLYGRLVTWPADLEYCLLLSATLIFVVWTDKAVQFVFQQVTLLLDFRSL